MIPTILTAINTVELIGSFVARHIESGTTVDMSSRKNRKTTKSAIPVICRELIAQGHDPQERVHVIRKALNRDGTIPVFKRDRTLGAWADVDMIESDTRSLSLVKYRPLPDSLKATERHPEVSEGNPAGNCERRSTASTATESGAA
jgi:hypothetical protein